MSLPKPIPGGPEWHVDWERLSASYAWIAALQGCEQNPQWHAEGDVWVHTRMVAEAMAANPVWRDLEALDRDTLFAAALLHDVAKPACFRREPDGRITARGHSARGEVMARRILWELGTPIETRERICALVRSHQVPFFLFDRPDRDRLLFAISHEVRCRDLALLTEADARGRVCADRGALLEKVELFVEYCREMECLDAPRAFVSAHSRFEYFRREGRDPNWHAHEAFRCEVVLLSGLPGAGKDTWIRDNAASRAVVSLDAIRHEMGVTPDADQGPVVAAGRQRARELLRQGTSFVWNATNLSRRIRRQCIDLFADYGARVRIVYLEAAPETLRQRNQSRAMPISNRVLERMLLHWEVPNRIEAHDVEWVQT
ncbi:MAG: AAA family ATPase [Candidatus Latescibacterota bacterium]|nr:MAG: AAA family ATPase [Candidatus Latescibacterota bacterium]